jgi:nitrite reductase/ring-hydroxylating ferredoxin subunit
VTGARPAAGAVLVRLGDLADGEARAIDFREGEALFAVIVVRRGDAALAYENVCPHLQMPLERPDGRVVVDPGGHLVCAMHGASFRVADGACMGGPARRALTPFAVAVRDGVVVAA